MGIILRALITASVLSVVVKKAIQRICGLFYCQLQKLPVCIILPSRKKGDKHVLGYPGGPVAHRLPSVSHPPEMLTKIGGKNTPPELVFDIFVYKRAYP